MRWLRSVLVVGCFLTQDIHAYAPITWMQTHASGHTLMPKGFKGWPSVNTVPPQVLVIGSPEKAFISSVPYFTANSDKSIIWDDMGWCVEASGRASGDAVRVNQCNGDAAQKWNWIPDGQGRNMIQLKDTNKCLDVKRSGLNEAEIVLGECGSQMTDAWKFEKPLLVATRASAATSGIRQALVSFLSIAGVGVLGLGAWRRRSRNKERVVAVGQGGLSMSMFAGGDIEANMHPMPTARRAGNMSMMAGAETHVDKDAVPDEATLVERGSASGPARIAIPDEATPVGSGAAAGPAATAIPDQAERMADKLSPKQVEEVAQVLQSLSGRDGSCDLTQVVSCLRNSPQTVFSPEAVDSIAAAIAALEQPLDSKRVWAATPNRGLFFVFEGLDRSGKSTQSKLLAKKLEMSGPVKWMSFPNRATAVGTLIDLYLRRMIELPDETVHLLFSANRWESAHCIVDDLNSGTSIVCDRYAFSGVAYSASKGLDLSWCQAPDIGLPVPDGVFFLHVDESVGASRANFGDERYENSSMQARVRNEFRQPAIRAGVEWHDVDGARDIQVIHDEICGAVEVIKKSDQESNLVKLIPRLWVS